VRGSSLSFESGRESTKAAQAHNTTVVTMESACRTGCRITEFDCTRADFLADISRTRAYGVQGLAL
jgi:hypothetical protein